jgi:endonuclease/exonuclease/phosphatase family metal-dependent hydrolase
MLRAMCCLMLIAVMTAFVEPTQAAELRVMSFNIRYGSANDGKDAWPNRQELVVKTITNFQPDLLGTQETQGFQAEYLKEQLPDFEYIGWSRDASENGEQCGILIRSDRFEVVKSGQFWLSETPDEKFSKSWDSSLPRVATWVQLKDKKADKREFIFANTHFDHRGVEARRNSATLLRKRLLDIAKELPIVVTGDFNCDEGSEPWKELLSGETLQDSLRRVHPTKADNEGTFHGFHGTPGAVRIDWVLSTSHLQPTESLIDRSNDNGRYPSDHFPVTARFAWAE